MICNVPMQPIDSSYSKQWHEWIQAEILSRELEHITILPPALVEDNNKGYTDTASVIEWRANQLRYIANSIHSGLIPKDKRVVFFFHNAWFPIDQLAFLRDMLGAHDWKFIGCFRDGTYDKWDMSSRNNMYTWGEDIENGWLKIYDAIVVGSQYHKDTIVENRRVRENKISVIPWHVEVPKIEYKKENIVVWPHRLDPEKQVGVFNQLARDCSSSEWDFVCTRDYTFSKTEYYNFLAKSKIVVSTALLEMFGNAMVEATLLGCIPLVPDRLSYQEMFNRAFRYRDYAHLVDKLKDVMEWKQIPEINDILNWELWNKIQDRHFFANLFQLIEEV